MEAFKRNNNYPNRNNRPRNPYIGLEINIPSSQQYSPNPNGIVLPMDIDLSLIHTYSQSQHHPPGGGYISPPGIVDTGSYYPYINNNQHQFNNKFGSPPFGSPSSFGSPLASIENIQTPPTRSPSKVFTSPGNVEGDVFVMDGIMVGSGSGSRGGSPRAGMTGSSFKTDICRNFKNGSCRYGASCPFTHGKEDQPSKAISSSQNKPQAQSPSTMVCKTFAATGSCIYGVKCRHNHPVSSASSPSSVTKFNAVTLSRPSHVDWSPVDDGIEVHLPLSNADRVTVHLPHSSTDYVAPRREDVNAFLSSYIQRPPQRKRLPAFTEFCPK